MDDPLKEIKTIIRSVLVSNKEALTHGVNAQALMRDYQDISYEVIPFKKYGCSGMEQLASKMPDVIQIVRGPGGEPLYKPVSSEDTKRIESLVSRQRSSKKKSLSKGRRPVKKASSWHRAAQTRAPRQTPVRQNTTPARRWDFFRPPSRTQRPPPLMPNKPVAMVSPSFMPAAAKESRPTQEVKFGANFTVPPRFKKRIGKPAQSEVEVRFGKGNPSASWEESIAQSVPAPPVNHRSPRDSPSPDSKHTSPAKTDYKSAINLYVQHHQLVRPVYDTMSLGMYGPLTYKSTVIIQDTPYGSTEKCLTKKEAEQSAAKHACTALNIDADAVNFKPKAKDPVISDSDLKQRIVTILSMKPNGLFSTRIAGLYRELYDCEPPSQPVLEKKLAQWSDCCQVEFISQIKRTIIYPVTQGVKLTQSSVSLRCPVPDPVAPRPGDTIRGYVSYVVDLNRFYVQRSADVPQIERLQEQIRSTYESRGSPKQLLSAEPGDFCVAKYEDAWYRAKILTLTKDEKQEQYKLFYVDYGNCEVVSSLRARRILENLCTLPQQALQCSLDQVYPKGEKWEKSVLDQFVNTYNFVEEMKFDIISVEDCCCSVRALSPGVAGSLNEDVVRRGLAVESPLPAEPPPIQFPEGKEWDVYVSYITSTTHVILRIVGQNYSDELKELEEESLPRLESEGFTSARPLLPDALCAVKVRDNADIDWHRVRVVKVQGQRASVYFLDHGDSDIVSISDLRPLQPAYNQLPYQAISCKLTGLESFEQDSRVLKALYDSALGKTCVADIDDKVDKLSVTLWDTTSEVDININEKVSTVLTIEDLKPKLPLEGDTVECYVSHVTAEGLVYINIQGPGLLELNNMSEELNDIYSKTDVKLFISNPEVQQPCVAKFVEGDYEGWYRALIKEVYPKQRKVLAFYVDYGNSQILPFSSLRLLSPQSKYLKPLPMQALPCELHELPPKDCKFTDRIIQRIVELCPLDELRTVEVVKRPQGGYPHVELYYTDEDDVMQGVSEVLFKENLFASEKTEADSVAASFSGLQLDIAAASSHQRHRLMTENEVQALSSPSDKAKVTFSPGSKHGATSPGSKHGATSPGAKWGDLAESSSPCSPASSDRDLVEYRDLMTGAQIQELEDYVPKTPTSPLSPVSPSARLAGTEGLCLSAGSPPTTHSPAITHSSPQTQSPGPHSPPQSTPSKPTSPSDSPSSASHSRPESSASGSPSLTPSQPEPAELSHGEPQSAGQLLTQTGGVPEDTNQSTDSTGFGNHSDTVAFLQSGLEDYAHSVFEEAELEGLESPPSAPPPATGDKVYITWVADPGNFRCIAAEAVTLLGDLMEQMLVYYTEHEKKLGLQMLQDTCSEGDIAAGLYNQLWYRVCVKKILMGQAAVHFVDYGDYTIIPLSDLRVLTAPFRKLPFQAHKAKLSGVFPPCVQTDEGWSEAAQQRFSGLVMERTFTAWILGGGGGGEVLSVTLVDEEAAPDNRFIHSVLLRENLAVKQADANVNATTQI